jgi:hypothetical protein
MYASSETSARRRFMRPAGIEFPIRRARVRPGGAPVVTNACAVCSHPRLASIEALIAAGTRPLNAVARDFDVSYDSLKRHVRNNHAWKAGRGEAPSPPGTPSGAVELDPVEELKAQLARLNAVPTAGLTAHQLISLSDAQRKATESLRRAMPPPPPPPSDAPGLAEYIDGVDRVLLAYGPAAIRAHLDLQRTLRGMGPVQATDEQLSTYMAAVVAAQEEEG